jgi:hypothetical protein
MTFFMIFWTYSLHIGNRPPYRESAENALRPTNFFMILKLYHKTNRAYTTS